MFHWICPECGREIPPSVRECQACDPKAVVPSVVEPIESTRLVSPVAELKLKPIEAPLPQTPPPAPVVEPALIAEQTPQKVPLVEAIPVPERAAPSPIADKFRLVPEPVPAAPPIATAIAPQSVAPAAPVALPRQPEPVAEVAAPGAEPVPLAVAPKPEPVVEVISAPVEVAPKPEPVAEAKPAPVVAPAPPLEVVPVEVEPKPEPVAAVPVAEEAPVAIAPQPQPVSAPVEEAAPSAEPIPEPVVAAPPTAEAIPQQPIAEPVSTIEPVAEPVIEPVPVVAAAAPETPPAPEPALVAIAPPAEDPQISEPAVETPAVSEPVALAPEPESPPVLVATAQPVVEAAAVAEAPSAPAVPEPAPIVESKPVREPEAQIKLHEVPDPLLALAEEIRAAQAARAAIAAAPPETAGLLGLVEAVGIQEQSPLSPSPVEDLEPPAPSVEPVAPEKTEAAAATAEAAKPVALLAPPERETALLVAPELVGQHEVRPVAMASVSLPTAEPEPVALAEPQVQPVALAPEPQPEGPTLPLAPMLDYRPTTNRLMRPVPPPVQIMGTDSAPRITLPGPTLPPELTRLQDANVVNVMGENTAQRAKEAIAPAKKSAPGWMVSGLVMLLLLAAGLGVVFYLLPHTVADAKPAPTPAVAATTQTPTGGSSPLAKFVEVTGFRIITSSVDANKKSEVQYLIVNHSDADISDANVFITLRSAKPGQAPICRFSFKIPSLGPFESKEMSSPIEKAAHAISLPDWQDLRADVQISQ